MVVRSIFRPEEGSGKTTTTAYHGNLAQQKLALLLKEGLAGGGRHRRAGAGRTRCRHCGRGAGVGHLR